MKKIVVFLIPILMMLTGCSFIFDMMDYDSINERKMNDAYDEAVSELGNISMVKEDLNFISSYDSVKIKWTSSNEDVVSNTGKVIRPLEDTIVILSLEMTCKDESLTKLVTITVLKQEIQNGESDSKISEIKSMAIGTKVSVIVTVNYQINEDSYIVNDDTGYIFVCDIDDTSLSNFNFKKVLKIEGEIATNDIYGKYIKNITKVENLDAVGNIKDDILKNDLYQMDKTIDKYLYLDKMNLKSGEISGSYYNVTLEKDSYLVTVSICECSENYSLIKSLVDDTEYDYEISLSSVFSVDVNQNANLFATSNTILTNSVIDKNTTSFMPNPSSYDRLQDKIEEDEKEGVGLPQSGSPKILVIPVEFTDALLSKEYPDGLDRLEKALFGTETQTGWESVKTYYQKSSYGKLDIEGTILPVYSTGHSTSYYNRMYNQGGEPDYEIIKAALTYYDKDIDYKDYDYNNDGYIDSLYLIYTAPVDYGDGDLWWAYTYQYMTDDYEYYNTDEGQSRRVEANYYLWAGFDFMDELIEDYSSLYNPKKIKVNVNASTYIHETGHLLGLDDYYDYYEGVGPAGGLGGADMMDQTVGDHNPFSKIMLGWTTPYIVTNSTTTYHLGPFEKTGNTILITKKWNNSYFSEYLLISYYTPTGLNYIHSGVNGLFSIPGVVIYHVIGYADDNIGSRYNESNNSYWSLFSYNNSDTKYKLISILEADGDGGITSTKEYASGGWAKNSDLFGVNDIFGYNTNSNFRWSDGSKINFKISFNNMNEHGVNVVVTY